MSLSPTSGSQPGPSSIHMDLLNVSREQLLSMHTATVEFLQELRRRINALPCINKLPVELLVEIFKYATHSHANPLYNIPVFRKIDNNPLLSLITITHVCRRWREIVVDTPMLWGRIPILPNDSLLKLFVERSRLTPLTATVVVKNKARKLADNILSGTSARLQTLHVFDARSSYARSPPLYQRPLQLQLPSLICCTIVSKSERRDRLGWPHWSSSETMPTLFCTSTSTLRALAIVPVAWLPGNAFPRLTHLFLSFSMHFGANLVDHLHRLLLLLANTPRLAHMQLRDVGQARDSFSSNIPFSQSSDRKPVALPHLQSLIVTESGLRMVFSFLDCLEMPENVVMRFNGMDMNYGTTANPPAIRISHFPLMNVLSRLELSAIKRTLHLVAGPAEAYDTASPTRPLHAGFWIHAKTHPEHEDNDWKPWLSELHTMFPLSSIKTLHICLQAQEMFAAILPHMTHLVELGVLFPDQKVDVWEPCVKSLCAVLGRWDIVFCPQLRTLCIDTHIRPEKMPCYSRIADMAAVREQRGRRLRRVVLRAVLAWRPWDPSVDELWSTVFARLHSHVDEVAYCGPGDAPLCPFEMHEMWKAADVDAEKYWGVEPQERDDRRYVLPWMLKGH